jgi:hypothetical protein
MSRCRRRGLSYVQSKRRNANWIGHILRRNCLLEQVIAGYIEGRAEMTRGRGRRSKQLLDGLKETRGCWKLQEEALDRTVRRTRFGRGCGPAEYRSLAVRKVRPVRPACFLRWLMSLPYFCFMSVSSVTFFCPPSRLIFAMLRAIACARRR